MAAGLGFKDFVTGEVLTAADVDGYLMQGIWVFTNATARDAAVTSPQEGNFAFTKDNNSLWYYDGATWVASGATGDIEGVTAGVGISGGGTSGTVTVTNSMATAIDAKGDLVVGTGADTFARLASSASNGDLLTVDTSTATGLKWAAAAGGGGMTLLNTGGTALTGSSVSVSSIPGTYNSLYIVLANLRPSVDGEVIRVRYNNDSNSRYFANSSMSNSNAFSTSHLDIQTDADNVVTTGVVIIEVFNYADTTTWKLGTSLSLTANNTTPANASSYRQALGYNQTTAITEVNFFVASGNMAGGTAYVYGVK